MLEALSHTAPCLFFLVFFFFKDLTENFFLSVFIKDALFNFLVAHFTVILLESSFPSHLVL